MTAFALAILLAAVPARAVDGAAVPAREDLDALFQAAQSAYRSGEYAGSARSLARVIAEMEADGSRPASRDQWRQALLRLAQVEATLGHGSTARAAIERALAVEPDLAVDPEQFSPRFRREVEQARARLELAPRLRLGVSSAGTPAAIRVDGQPMGQVPAELSLPAGRYRVELGSGAPVGGAVVQLERDERLAFDSGGAAAPPAAPVRAAGLAASPPATATGGPSLHAEAPGEWMRPTAMAAGGLAVVAAGLAVWQGVVAGNAADQASSMLLPDGALRPGASPADYAAATARFDSARTSAWIAGGASVALAGGAVLLWVLAPSTPVSPTPSGLALAF
jgi:hypothetical protein